MDALGWALCLSHGPSIRAQSSGVYLAHHSGTSGPHEILLYLVVFSALSLGRENTRVSNMTGASGARGFVWGPWFHVVPVVSFVGKERWPLVSTALPALSIVPLSLLVSVSIHCSISHLWVPFFCSSICPFYLLPAKALAGSDAVC